MADHNIDAADMSESIEMYLVRVAQLQQHEQPVPISHLAQELAITAVSANEMCRKLTKRGLIKYEPYKGVTLTTDGDSLARRVLRARHLWEAFFVEKLDLEPAEADEIACRFEHVTPDDLADRLAAFLDRLDFSLADEPQACLLTNLTAGKRGYANHLTSDNPVIKAFLKQQNLVPGEMVTVLGVATDGSMLLQVAGQPLSLSQAVARTVEVVPEFNSSASKEDFSW